MGPVEVTATAGYRGQRKREAPQRSCNALSKQLRSNGCVEDVEAIHAVPGPALIEAYAQLHDEESRENMLKDLSH